MKFRHNYLNVKNTKIPIFIISLKEDTKRRRKLMNLFSTKIVRNYFPAIDTRHFKRAKLDSYCNMDKVKKFYNRKLYPGEVGIALSHKKIYEHIVKNKIAKALVCEDDIFVKNSNWKNDINNILVEIKNFNDNKAILCNLGISSDVLRKRKILIFKWQPTILKKLWLLNLKRNNFKLAHSYLINFQAAKNILIANKKINCVADDWRVFHKQKCFDYFLISKKLFYQNKQFKSRIQNINKIKKINFYNKHFYCNILKIKYIKTIVSFFYQWFALVFIFTRNKN